MVKQPQLEREPIRVLLAEDHHILRRALRVYLERKGLCIVAEVADGRTLPTAVDIHRPHLLLTDLAMPDYRPATVIGTLRAAYPHLKIIVLSAYSNAAEMASLFEVGIDGYVLKDDSSAALMEAIRQVMAGHEWISPRAAAALAVHLRQETNRNKPKLTPRQLEVLALMARGLQNDQIAAELVLSENTVRNHIAAIFQNLGVDNRVAAVVHSLAANLINLDEVKGQLDIE